MKAWLESGRQRWQVDLSRAHDLSIPTQFDGPQPSYFDAAPAAGTPFHVGAFTGEVRTGASCNCMTYTLTPHCNGTHTESAAHLLAQPATHPVHRLATQALVPARVVTLGVTHASDAHDERDEFSTPDDLLLTRHALMRHDVQDTTALIVRTHPNSADKHTRRYNVGNAPYFTRAAMEWVVGRGIQHLLVDVPSLDRADDGGRLTCHRMFFGMPDRAAPEQSIQRPEATVTELCFIDDSVADGTYALSLQIAPWVTDAAPSRPLIYPMTPA